MTSPDSSGSGATAATATALGDLLLGFARCLGAAPRNVIYVSAPITTGRDFASWYAAQRDPGSAAYDTRLRRDIVAPNLRRARPLVNEARERWPARPVVDPTALEDVPGWAQHDYHFFWTRLIQEYAGTVVFADGWQYSSGCALEFAAAVAARCDLFDHHFSRLPPEDGERLLHESAAELARAGAPADTVLAALRTLGSRHGATA